MEIILARKQPRSKQSFQFGCNRFNPLTENQAKASKSIDSGMDLMVIGYAGTGKTYLAVNKAMELYTNQEIKKIHIIRSAVPTRNQGFLPGTLKEKHAVYELPYHSIFSDICGRGDAYEILSKTGAVTFDTTSYLRGLTFDDCVIILDEIQNMTWEEINTVYTRLGENSRCIMCGDFRQTDKDVGKSGLDKLLKVVNQLDTFEIVEMGKNDIVRSEKVKDWIIAVENTK